MPDPITFLNGLAQALSSLSLYPEGHTSRERALDQVYLSLRDLLDDDPSPSFSFLGDEVIYNDRPIRELREWGWSKKLSDIGVQRLLFTVESTRDELEDFLDEVLARVTIQSIDSAEARQMRRSSIRYGAVGIRGEHDQPRTSCDWRFVGNLRLERLCPGRQERVTDALQMGGYRSRHSGVSKSR